MTDDQRVDVEVEVGGWEHECCGEAIERGQVVDFDCQRTMGDDGLMHLSFGRHSPAERRVRGRVRSIEVIRPKAAPQPVLRVPSGRAPRGYDPNDDGHLENPWTGQAATPRRGLPAHHPPPEVGAAPTRWRCRSSLV